MISSTGGEWGTAVGVQHMAGWASEDLRYLPEPVLVEIVIEVKKEVILACQLNSQRQRVLLFAHDQDLDLYSLQRAHLPTSVRRR